MSDENAREDANLVVISAKTPFDEDGIRDVAPSSVPVRQALEALRARAVGDEATRYLAEQIGREMAARQFSILSVSRDGQLHDVAPDTPLEKLAEVVEVRTPEGLKKVRMVSIEVQSYGEVGHGRSENALVFATLRRAT